MEKQLSATGYWLGLICTVLALIFRLLTALNKIPPFLGVPGGNAISYLSFLHGALLFFVLTIASWCRTTNSRGQKLLAYKPFGFLSAEFCSPPCVGRFYDKTGIH